MDILFHGHQAPGDPVRLSDSQEPLHHPLFYQVLVLYSVTIMKKAVWRPHLPAAELTHSATTQEHSIVQNIIHLQTVSADRDVFVPHNRDNNSKFQSNVW